jgi:hypothetical protein
MKKGAWVIFAKGQTRKRIQPAFGAKGGAIFRILVLFNPFSGEHAFR